MTKTYIPKMEYNEAVDAFAAALDINIGELKMAVGAAFEVWPENVCSDAERARETS